MGGSPSILCFPSPDVADGGAEEVESKQSTGRDESEEIAVVAATDAVV